MKYIGIDPSFLGCTISEVDTETKTIEDSFFIAAEKADNVQLRILIVTYWIKHFLDTHTTNTINIETPFINKQNGRTSGEALRLYQEIIHHLYFNNYDYLELRPKQIKSKWGNPKAKKADMYDMFFLRPYSNKFKHSSKKHVLKDFTIKQTEGFIDSIAIALYRSLISQPKIKTQPKTTKGKNVKSRKKRTK